MTHYPDFDPYFVREHHKELLREAEHQRLVREARKARENRKPRPRQFVVFVPRSTQPLLRKAGLVR